MTPAKTGTLQIGRKYKVAYRIGSRKTDQRLLTGTYLGTSLFGHVFSCRPDAGNVTVPGKDLIGHEPARVTDKPYANHRMPV